jgi:hypothetical protein
MSSALLMMAKALADPFDSESEPLFLEYDEKEISNAIIIKEILILIVIELFNKLFAS